MIDASRSPRTGRFLVGCRPVLVLCLAVFAWAAPASAVVYVKHDATGLQNGTSWANAYPQLQPAIDAAADPRPLAYLINCTHASIFRSALQHEVNSSRLVRERLVGLLANTAALSPEELDNSAGLVEEEPEAFGRSVAGLHGDLGMKILGGCCGTDDRHIRCLAKELALAE